jgi:hypothetical protein
VQAAAAMTGLAINQETAILVGRIIPIGYYLCAGYRIFRCSMTGIGTIGIVNPCCLCILIVLPFFLARPAAAEQSSGYE